VQSRDPGVVAKLQAVWAVEPEVIRSEKQTTVVPERTNTNMYNCTVNSFHSMVSSVKKNKVKSFVS
jgi:hypothetical protein